MNDFQVSQTPGHEAQGAVANDLFRGAGFSLWGLVIAKTNPHRLKRLRKNPTFSVILSEAKYLSSH
jgi:hypothetical protein